MYREGEIVNTPSGEGKITEIKTLPGIGTVANVRHKIGVLQWNVNLLKATKR